MDIRMEVYHAKVIDKATIVHNFFDSILQSVSSSSRPIVNHLSFQNCSLHFALLAPVMHPHGQNKLPAKKCFEVAAHR